MSGSDGVRWHCPNPDCNWSLVTTQPVHNDSSPRCVCGRTMQRGDAIPAFHYLDFLRDGLEQAAAHLDKD